MTEIAKTGTTALSDSDAYGLEEITHADIPKKYIALDNGSGKITTQKGEVLLGDTQKAFKITPVFTYEEWQYVTPDGSQVLSRELISQSAKNLTLKDNEMCHSSANGVDTAAIRKRSRVVLVLVQDREFDGPMFLTLRGQKLWQATNLISKWLENKEKKIPIFGQSFMVTSEQKTNKKGQKYYIYSFKASDLTAPDKISKFQLLYMQLRESKEKLLRQNEDEGSAQESE